MTAPSAAVVDQGMPTSPAKRAPRYFPGWFWRSVLGGAVLMTLVLRLLPDIDGVPFPLSDRGFGNIFSFLFGAFALLVAWGWISFRSDYPLIVRMVVMLGIPLGIVLFVAAFRIAFDGSMVAQFSPRWLPPPDRRLGQVVIAPKAAEQAGIDLTTTTPADFPEFLGPGRKCWIEDPGLATDWDAQPPKLLWKQPIGAGWSAFAAVNGYAVTMEQRGDEEWVTCYEVATGKPVWGREVEARHENPMGGIGPRSTPTIAGGRVFTVGATGILQCLDGATGDLVWSHDLFEMYGLTKEEAEQEVMWGRAGSPLVVDDLVVVPAGGKPGSTKSLVAFRAEDGEKAWEAGDDQISYASPSLITLAGQRQIVIVNEKTVSGHEPATGKQLWSVAWDGDSSSSASSSQAVAAGGDLLLLTKGYGGGAKLLDFSGSGSQPQDRWVNPGVLATKFTNVTVIGNHIYGLSDGILDCVSLETGERAWKKGRYRQGQVLGVGQRILIQAEDGRVVLVEANPDQFTELTSFKAIDGITWNNPCLYGKLLLVRNGEEAACYELP